MCMANFICQYCGKEFQAKPSSKRKYCCKECSNKAAKGKSKTPRVEKVKVICAECGKEEFVNPCRAKKYVCCSVECLGKYNSKRYMQGSLHTCPICGNEFYLKPSHEARVKTQPCCSRECAAKLKEITYIGENNHQYGLKGELNASFKGEKTTKKNAHVEDVWLYRPNRPDANKDGRITEHRLKVLEQSDNFDACFFDQIGDYKVFKSEPRLSICVHHIDGDHNNNTIQNLIPLTKATHRKVHNDVATLAQKELTRLIGVLKQGEMLEKPVEVNQQLSLVSDNQESSETNNRILNKDSNVDTSALLNNIKEIVNDYIVQTKNITKKCYELAIKEILESEINSSEE